MKIKRNSVELKHSKRLIAETLKAEIARQLWMEEGFYQVFNSTDNEFERAMKYLNH